MQLAASAEATFAFMDQGWQHIQLPAAPIQFIGGKTRFHSTIVHPLQIKLVTEKAPQTIERVNVHSSAKLVRELIQGFHAKGRVCGSSGSDAVWS
jgi:hypothetical protein